MIAFGHDFDIKILNWIRADLRENSSLELFISEVLESSKYTTSKLNPLIQIEQKKRMHSECMKGKAVSGHRASG